MPSVPLTTELRIHSGEALGPLTLGATLHSTVNVLLEQKSIFPRLNFFSNSESPVSNPIYIVLEANGLRLRFDGESQTLQLIEVTEFGKLGLLYGETNLSRNGGPPSYHFVYSKFGPTESGELMPAQPNLPSSYVLSYPGIVFRFLLPDTIAGKRFSHKEFTAFLHSSDSQVLAVHLAIYPGNKWRDFQKSLGEPKPRLGTKKSKKERKSLSPLQLEQLEYTEIFPNEKVELKFQNGKTVTIAYNKFTAQDAISELGPPSEVYTKSDNRLDIHNKAGHDEIESGPLPDAPEYFFNYFQYGVALLFSPLRDHTMQKVLLHSNLPQSHAFQRFHRCRWIFKPTGGKKDPSSTVLHSEMNFDEIKTALEKLSGPTPKPMIVNRGNQASPSSSIELVSDDILTATPYGCTELFGFAAEGLVFEVLEGGWVDQVTCFKA